MLRNNEDMTWLDCMIRRPTSWCSEVGTVYAEMSAARRKCKAPPDTPPGVDPQLRYATVCIAVPSRTHPH